MAMYPVDEEVMLRTKVAGSEEYCLMCYMEQAQKKGFAQAAIDLTGKLEGEKVGKIRVTGVDRIICKSCLEKALEEINA